jgi:hypothetical protein
MVGDHLVAEALRLERLRIVPEQLAHAGVDRGEQVGVVVGRHLLEDARQPLEAHACVDARERQRVATVGTLVELHEHEVPDLEPARTRLAVVGDALRAFAQVRAAVHVDLGARPAWPGLGHSPEVLVVAGIDIAPAGHPLRRQTDLIAPDIPGHLVVAIGRRRDDLAGDGQLASQEVPGPVDGLALEVVAEAPVAEHLEERVVPRRSPDLLEIVVLAGDAQAALVIDGTRVGPRLRASEDILELDHAGVREQQRLVAGRHERGAGDDRMAALGEKVDEPPPDLGGGQRLDPGVGFVGGNRHRP